MSHPITPENVTRAELANGIVILVKENRTNASITLRGRLRGQIVTGLREAEEDTRYVAGRKFQELSFPKGHPYHRSDDGSEATVKKLTRAKLAEFHSKFYRPDGAIFVIVGDIEAQKAI